MFLAGFRGFGNLPRKFQSKNIRFRNTDSSQKSLFLQYLPLSAKFTVFCEIYRFLRKLSISAKISLLNFIKLLASMTNENTFMKRSKAEIKLRVPLISCSDCSSQVRNYKLLYVNTRTTNHLSPLNFSVANMNLS